MIAQESTSVVVTHFMLRPVPFGRVCWAHRWTLGRSRPLTGPWAFRAYCLAPGLLGLICWVLVIGPRDKFPTFRGCRGGGWGGGGGQSPSYPPQVVRWGPSAYLSLNGKCTMHHSSAQCPVAVHCYVPIHSQLPHRSSQAAKLMNTTCASDQHFEVPRHCEPHPQ